MKTNAILKRLRAEGSAASVAGMARYGIRPAKAYGVSTPVMRAIARELGRDTELASALWSSQVLEARMLATMIADPQQISEDEVERWVHDFDCWSVCDSACICLLWKTPFAWRKVREWSSRKPEYERRAAFALLTQSHLLCELGASLGIIRCHHRIIGRQAPFLAIVFRRHVVLCAQMTLERFELLAVFQAHDVFGRHRPLDWNRGLKRLRRHSDGAAVRDARQCRVDLADQGRNFGAGDGIVADIGRDDFCRQLDECSA